LVGLICRKSHHSRVTSHSRLLQFEGSLCKRALPKLW